MELLPYEDHRRRSVKCLGLSSHIEECLRMLKVKTIGHLIRKTERELMMRPNFGLASLNAVRKALAKLGLALKPPRTYKNLRKDD